MTAAALWVAWLAVAGIVFIAREAYRKPRTIR
jgi:hypothetical protein